jgi:Protein of unknown function (DUF1517)
MALVPPTSTLWKSRPAAVPAGIMTSKLYDFQSKNALQMSRRRSVLGDNDIAKTMEPSDEPDVLQPVPKDTSTTTLFHTLARTQRLYSTAVLQTFLASVCILCLSLNQQAHAALLSGGHAMYQEALLPPAPIPIPLQDASTIVLAFLDSPFEDFLYISVYVGAAGIAALVGVGLAKICNQITGWDDPIFDVSQWQNARATLFPVGVSTLCLSVAVSKYTYDDAIDDAFRLFSPGSPILSMTSNTAEKSAARVALRLLNQKSQMYAACVSCRYTRDDDGATSRQFHQWAVEVDQKSSDIVQRNAKNRNQRTDGTTSASGRFDTGSRDTVVQHSSPSDDGDTMTVVSLIWSVERNVKPRKVLSIKDVEKILTDIVVDANEGDCIIRALDTSITGVSRDDLLEDFAEMTIV